ncbi:MAG TPA: MFS transporter [Candidatus Eisenbacteria bacterium]|nr:MFS transporter [Candidatus Eisenbacteria bacterium]
MRPPRSVTGSGAGSPPGTGIAVATAVAMIAYQVAAKATRDTLFLTSFPVSLLPAMTVASAVVSILMVFVAARALARFGPENVIPIGFAGSAILIVVQWVLAHAFPSAVAVAFYLHYGGLGALLISGFWAFLNERFDPRAAKRALGRIAAGGTVGGLVGGVLADRVGTMFNVSTMLPILAAIHALCATLVFRLREPSSPAAPTRTAPPKERAEEPETDEIAPPTSVAGESAATVPTTSVFGFGILRQSPYLRTLVALVVLVTISEGLVDWLFKARASTSMARPEDLLRLFGAFYTGVSLLTVIVQAALSRVALERLGLARSVATLPAAVGLGSFGAMAWPGLGSALALRATESVLSNSLYRAGYEVLFTPLPPREKRGVKTLVDVGAARAGDFLGAALIQSVLLAAGMASAPVAILVIVALACAGSLVVASRLHAGYVGALERGLVSRAVHLDLSEVHDATTRSMLLQRSSVLALSQVLDRSQLSGISGSVERGASATGAAGAAGGGPGGGEAAPTLELDPLARRDAALASGRPAAVRAALREGPLPPELVPRAITLLAWDEAARDAIEALRKVGDDAVPALAAALADSKSDFAIRRRVPLVLGTVPSAAAVEGLLGGLADRRFEVRYRCGRALHHLVTTYSKLGIPPDRVFESVLREVGAERRVWEGQRLLDQLDDESWSPAFDEALRARANRSLEHVFTLLSLALPRQPLQIAWRGLHTDDPLLRGTALEYLETTLPPDVRKPLWPYLEDTRPKKPETRSTDEVLADLLRSNQSIAIQLESLRRRESTEGES